MKALASLLLLLSTSLAGADSLSFEDFAEIEARSGIPDQVLYSLALTESQRNGKPWPWTMNYAGKSYFFRDRETLHDAMQLLIARGRKNFDVGPMQVHWRYHSKKFDSTWAATDPFTNMVVGAQILIDRYRESGNWVKAIAAYHSKTEHLGRIYLTNFAKNYDKARKEKM